VLTFYAKGKESRIALMKDRFVPVILDGYLRGTADEKDFLKSCGTVGNGFTYIAASGRKLGGDSYLGANGLEKALEDFEKLPDLDRKPAFVKPEEVGAKASLPIPPPPGGLRANVYFTYLERGEKGDYRRALWHVEGQPGEEPGSAGGRNQVITHVDKFWLTAAEWKSLVPEQPEKDRSAPLPAALQHRLVRFYASDLAHRSTGDRIRSAEFRLAVEEATADAVTLRLEGTTETGVPFEEAPLDGKNSEAPGLCGAEYRWLGLLRYDRKAGAFDRFRIVALGHGWGGNRKQAATTNFYRGGEHRRWPMGIAFELLTTDRPIDRIPPQNANPYRAGNRYWESGARDR
jgi:hypothetical protein